MKLDPDWLVSSALMAFVVVAIAAVTWQSCMADAQPLEEGVTDELLLDALRVRVSEADFRPECDELGPEGWLPRGCVTDGAAIVERHHFAALRRRTTLHQELRAYSRRATGQRPPRSPRGAWVAALTLDFSAPPPGWPERVPWARRTTVLVQLEREMRALLEAALAGVPATVCTQPPDHWGGIRCDGTNRGACDRTPSCWRRLDCGPTVNGFYVVECPRASMSPRSGNPTVPATIARGDQ